ncbi:MAG TPA: hypothetical protein VN495_04180, partial [Candidatus Paceibacterota bacterium]|nr:hypothetical protein [Candidatus Paceibacterota bacterium]
ENAGLPLYYGTHFIPFTKHKAVPDSADGRRFVDIDLSILGQPPDVFEIYEFGIRREYERVSLRLFREKRAEILQRFLDRPSIFLTPHFRHKYERQARDNLLRSIAQLTR